MDRPKIALIVPAFNEEKTIGAVVLGIKEYGIVIVVNDASTDATANEAILAGAVVIDHDSNKGYDGSLNTGFSKAAEFGCVYAITFDADNQHDPSLIPVFVRALEEGNTVAIGVRPGRARIAEKLFAFITMALYGIRDPLCGMKGYQMSLYRERGFFDSYRSIGSEMTLYAVKKKYPYIQINVPISQRIDKPRFGRFIKPNLKILRALFFLFIRHV
jgi:glycosyltransferase involved in cell wall biosynthesis